MTVQPLNDSGNYRILRDTQNHYSLVMVDKNGRPLAEPDREDLDFDEYHIHPEKREKLTFSEAGAYYLKRTAIIGSPNFFAFEFGRRITVKKLCRAIASDNYGISFDHTLAGLNKILQTPDFYDRWLKKGKNLPLGEEANNLITATAGYRNLPPSALSIPQRERIKQLNRLIIEATYPRISPRSSWIKDRDNFARTWRWMRKNMQRINITNVWTYEDGKWIPKEMPRDMQDYLFAWRWVPTLNGPGSQGGIIDYEDIGGIDRKGINAASDDIEIAAALYFAYVRGWGEQYLTEARNILHSAWQKYVAPAGSHYYFFAGDQFSWSGELNPSYFRPAYFARMFSYIDPSHPWHELVPSSYRVITESSGMEIAEYEPIYKGEKTNLPPNWIGLLHTAGFDDSIFFPGKAGEIFGWDAFRTLYAVAQDYAWYGNTTAYRYMTDCEIGPACFLRKNYISRNQTLVGLHHDGTRVRSDPRVPQTERLRNRELSIAIYGAALPYYHFAGDRSSAQRILYRLRRKYYNRRGYWGRNSRDYYSQNWAWFGLMLTNGVPPEIQEAMQGLPVPKKRVEREVILRNIPKPFLMQVDHELGCRVGFDQRAKLIRKMIVDKLSFNQLGDTVNAIAEAPDTALREVHSEISQVFTQLGKIYAIDKANKFELFAYLADFREYWNNSILLLSIYGQKAVEGSKKKDIRKAIKYCQEFRKKISLQGEVDPESYVSYYFNPRYWYSSYYLSLFGSGPLTDQERVDKLDLAAAVGCHGLRKQIEFKPHAYSLAILDLTEAELRAQVTKQDKEYYEHGITLAAAAINRILKVDRDEARPDYYVILKALLVIGDLYLRMHEASKLEGICIDHPVDYLAKAAEFYNYVDQINMGVNISAEDEGISLTITPQIIEGALKFNYDKKYLSKDQLQKARKTIFHHLKGVAIAKNASLYFRKKGEKDITDVLLQIKEVNRALQQLQQGAEDKLDFFVSFTRALRADLLLYLADRIKYYLWPENGADLQYIANVLGEIERLFQNCYPYSAEGEIIGDIVSALYSHSGASRPSALRKNDVIKRIFALNQRILVAGRSIYQEIPARFSFLFAASQTKVAEIAVRKAEFLDKAFRYLLPFYNHPVFTRKKPIPEDEFLGVELNYLKALLLAASKRKKNMKIALKMLRKVIIDARAHLEYPYSLYFEIHAQLKIAVILSKKKQTRAEALALFEKIREKAAGFSGEDRQEMSWRSSSFLAELYHEWANTLKLARKKGAKEKAVRALRLCFESDSEYDFNRRRKIIRTDFRLNKLDRRYQRIYGRPE